MSKISYLLIMGFVYNLGIHAQENAVRTLSPSLRECYENKYLLERDNRLPHTLNTFIAILRKIENSKGLNMDLRSLSVAILHRFRQDGIRQNPSVVSQDGISPYAPTGHEFFRHAKTLRFIQGNAILFPNNSISDIERCTLHFMLSSSINILKRDDEETVCRFANSAYRNIRSINRNDADNSKTNIEDVETLSPEEIETITNKKDSTENAIDPNSLYPELPPNHPDRGRMFDLSQLSKCPVENGVIKTLWGSISGGSILAGIAAAVQPENILLRDVLKNEILQTTYSSDMTLDNKWIATLAGDLAEVALIQGPIGDTLQVGVNGDWNSTAMPRWYFLNANKKLQFTTAEIRGDLDGLILANEVKSWYSKIPNLRLSQVVDMYYSAQGLFNSTIRACNRRSLFRYVAPNSTLSAQAYRASLVLSENLARATLQAPIIEKFAVNAANELSTYIPSSMNQDLSCQETDRLFDQTTVSVDLTIILDTNWPFASLQPILAYILEHIDINEFNSNFTIINGYDGNIMINNTNTILNFYSFNSSHYNNITRGLNLSKSIKILKTLEYNKLNRERSEVIGGKASNVVLIMPYNAQLLQSDKEYCLEQLKYMRQEMPDTIVLILTYGSKDTWVNIVENSTSDLFAIGLGDNRDALAPLDKLISRIKQIPKRLINTQCGANYVPLGSSNSFVDYVQPNKINFYRLHPNYFFSHETIARVKILGSGWAPIRVCTSRNLLHVNATEANLAASCMLINSNEHSVSVSCGDATFIHECQSLYLSVTANSSDTSYQCTDQSKCRYPHMIKYTISYENLVCTSSVNNIAINPIILMIVVIYCLLSNNRSY
ncbi:N-acetylmuramoyl-L-alanine amidase [Vespula squamosa]|uniref:N-acetylmuramoyl-L-alanine amidase n=1 Tax=Vespula squamosa TaxID=30214 RepID=A0ABD2B713_VESSQ